MTDEEKKPQRSLFWRKFWFVAPGLMFLTLITGGLAWSFASGGRPRVAAFIVLFLVYGLYNNIRTVSRYEHEHLDAFKAANKGTTLHVVLVALIPIIFTVAALQYFNLPQYEWVITPIAVASAVLVCIRILRRTHRAKREADEKVRARKKREAEGKA